MKHKISSEIDINAPPKVIWDILVQLDKYENWNPFIVTAQGTPKLGERLKNKMQPPGGRGMTFKPVVTEVKENQVFEWKGELLVPGVFTGYHRFELSQKGDVINFTQSEKFSGVLVSFMRKSLDNETLEGFKAMNEALKARAEASK